MPRNKISLKYPFRQTLFFQEQQLYRKTAGIKEVCQEWIFEGYFIAVAFFILVFWFADIQYFEEAGKHFTYEAFAYIGTVLPTIVSGAFRAAPCVVLAFNALQSCFSLS